MATADVLFRLDDESPRKFQKHMHRKCYESSAIETVVFIFLQCLEVDATKPKSRPILMSNEKVHLTPKIKNE